MRYRAGIVGLLSIFLVAPPALASCAAPTLTVFPSGAAAGETIAIRGHDWFEGCNDSCGGGCGGGSCADEETPLDDIKVTIDGIDVASADADRHLRFEVRVQVPDDLPPGRYDVRASVGGISAKAVLLVTQEGATTP